MHTRQYLPRYSFRDNTVHKHTSLESNSNHISFIESHFMIPGVVIDTKRVKDLGLHWRAVIFYVKFLKQLKQPHLTISYLSNPALRKSFIPSGSLLIIAVSKELL